jgi:hypothetical protein
MMERIENKEASDDIYAIVAGVSNEICKTTSPRPIAQGNSSSSFMRKLKEWQPCHTGRKDGEQRCGCASFGTHRSVRVGALVFSSRVQHAILRLDAADVVASAATMDCGHCVGRIGCVVRKMRRKWSVERATDGRSRY